MGRYDRGSARRRPWRGQTGRRRGGYQDPTLARRRILARALDLPDLHVAQKLSWVLVEPPTSSLH